MSFDLVSANGRSVPPRRLVVGMTGATGSILGIRLLEALASLGTEPHLVISEWAARTIAIETAYSLAEVRSLASTYYRESNQAAPISSGSFPADGMVIIPCSMNTLAAAAHGQCDKLIPRAADVTLNEGPRLVIVARELPLSTSHPRDMRPLRRAVAALMP